MSVARSTTSTATTETVFTRRVLHTLRLPISSNELYSSHTATKHSVTIDMKLLSKSSRVSALATLQTSYMSSEGHVLLLCVLLIKPNADPFTHAQ